MPSQREKEILEREIAKLTGAINRRSTPYTRPSRGGSNFNSSYKRNRTLVINNDGDGTKSDATPVTNNGEGTSSTGPGWVKSTAKNGNKSLMSVDMYANLEKARLAREPIRKARRLPRKAQSITLASSVAGPSDQRRVVIDGVTFEFDKDGQRLKRVGDSDAHIDTSSSTPTSFSMSGQQYLRTKRGNFVSAESVRKRRSSGDLGGFSKGSYGRNGKIVKSQEPCRYFTKTGHCNRASTCPFVHDPNRLAICSRFMRGRCPYSSQTCPVSHHPNAHNAPSCAHFQKTGECRNGPDCLYPHVRVSDDAKVCQAFVNDGWCDRGEECEERHAWECREYSETGECSKGVKCGLMHVLRAKALKGAEEDAAVGEATSPRKNVKGDETDTAAPNFAVDVRGDFEGQEDFIQFSTVVDVSSDEHEREESVDSDETEGEDESENEKMAEGGSG